MRGGVEWLIQHEVEPSAISDARPHSQYFIFLYNMSKHALTDLLFCIERISSSSSDGCGT